MNYISKYITQEEYFTKRSWGTPYTGFVIGYGYISMRYRVVMPPNQYGYNATWTNLSSERTHGFFFTEYDEDRSAEAVKLSLRGLFKEGEAVITVTSGMTLSYIAALFDVTVADLAKWNNIKNPDKIWVGQKLKILGDYFIIKDKVHNSNATTIFPDRVLEKSQNTNWLKNNIFSSTTTLSDKKELDLSLIKASYFSETSHGESKILNSSIVSTQINNATIETSHNWELNLGMSRTGISNNSISSALSLLGYVDTEISIEFNNIWDMSFNISIKEDFNKNNISNGISVGVSPIKGIVVIAAAVAASFLGRFMINTPAYSPAYSVMPVMNCNEVN